MHSPSDSAEGLRSSGEQLVRVGNFAQAEPVFARLVESSEATGQDWFNFGYVLRCNRRFDAAARAYEHALLAGLARPEEASLNLAAILSEHKGDWKGARTVLETALEARPGFVAGWLNLAQLFEDAGLIDDARKAYRSALELAPDNGRALGRLAVLASPSEDVSMLATRLANLVEDPATTLTDVAEAGFGLGHLLDARGQYDEAFAAFEAANDAVLEGRSERLAYDGAKAAVLIDQLISTFTEPCLFGKRLGRSPIFICGMFRSGSTLAEHLISRHSLVTAGGELETIPALAASISSYPDGLARIDTATTEVLAQRYFDELSARFADADWVTDKRPDNFLHIGLIKTLFPDAKIIHTCRDPLDTMLSIYSGNFDPSVSYAFNLADIADWSRQYRRLMAHWHSVYRDDIFILDYDRLVHDPEPELRAAIAFLELEWEEAILRTDRSPGFVRTLSSWQVRQPLHSRSSGRARNYERHLRRFIP